MEKDKPELSPEIITKIHQLGHKFEAMGQNLHSYLDGLLYADYLTYWDYIQLDVLLSLQNPKTPFRDESIFIMYHQITELYFKLVLHAIEGLTANQGGNGAELTIQIKRMNSYFRALIHSFEIMIDGMDHEQFLKFRMSLLPASGFQSAQYRMIEICCTDLDNLLSFRHRPELAKEDVNIVTKYNHLYWKEGASELATGKKTLTLKQFEKKYSEELIRLAKFYESTNLYKLYHSLPKEEQENPDLIAAMRELDENANIYWPLMHYKSAVRYLQKKPKDIAATGGTNWQKYLPPKNQFISFFPSLWSKDELENWGKRIQQELFSQEGKPTS